jgi:DNA anti-recombination protein RmuC
VPLLLVAGSLGSMLLNSCQQPETRVSDAKTEVADAQQKLTEAERNASDERLKVWQPFKTESEEKIKRNARALEDFRVKMAANTNAFRDRYQVRVEELERRNNALRDKIAEYRDESDLKLKDFQTEVSRDIDGLNTAIKDLPTSGD